MKENETQEHLSSTPAEGHGNAEEGSDLAEEPDQRRQDRDRTVPAPQREDPLDHPGPGAAGAAGGLSPLSLQRDCSPAIWDDGHCAAGVQAYRRLARRSRAVTIRGVVVR